MAIAIAISFDSGILLCADTTSGVSAGIHSESPRIFTKQYASAPSGARSIFLIGERVDRAVPALLHCERALDRLQPAEYTIDRMRATIEEALSDLEPEATLLMALHSPIDQRCSLFRTSAAVVGEFVGYDCQGPAAYLGHYLIRDRYRDGQSLDSLDLSTVFAIAVETVEGVRACLDGCGGSTEMIALYANGRASDVQLIREDIQKQRKLALLGDLSAS